MPVNRSLIEKFIKREFEFITVVLVGVIIITYLMMKFTGYAIPFFFGLFSLILLSFLGPFICFIPYLATTFFVPTRIYADYPITYNQVCGILYLSSFILWYFKRIPKLHSKIIFKILSLLTFYFLINALTGDDIKEGATSSVYLVLYFIICITIALQFREISVVKKYFWAILILTSLAGLVGLFEFATGIDLLTKSNSTWNGHPRINAMSPNAIVYGCSMMWAAPIGYFLFCQSKSTKWRILSLLLAIFCVMIALLTFSRQIYIYLFSTLITIAYFVRNRYSKKFIVFLAIMGFLSSGFIGQFLYVRFTTASKHEKDASLAFRMDGVQITKKVLSEKPFMGLGLGSYPTSWQNYLPGNTLIIHFYKTFKRYPDFGFNQLLVEGGYIGFFLSIFLFLAIIFFLIGAWKQARGDMMIVRSDYIGTLIVIMTMFLLQNMIQDTFLNIKTWMMFAFVLALEDKTFLQEKSDEDCFK